MVGCPEPEGVHVIERTTQALDERSHTAPFGLKGLRYIFPDHWSFLLGEIALYCFIVLVATGTYLALFFDPSTAQTVYHGSYAPLDGAHMTQAYRSTVHLSLDVKAGLLMRQTHHWAADVFVAAIALHLMRIVFTGAFRKPRELTYYVGLTILVLALLEGYLGYSLVDDLLSGMGLAIGYGVALSIPFVGANVAAFVWGGPFPGVPAFWSRMYIAHVFVLPLLIATLIAIHLFLVASLHHTQFRGGRRTEKRLLGVPAFPGQAPRSLGLDVRRLRRALSARRARPDQPDLAVGAVPRRRRHERRPAGLVPRLADRRAAAHARIRRDDRGPHRRSEPVLGRRPLPVVRLRRALPLADARAALRADRRPATWSTGPATPLGRTAFATALLRGCSSSSWRAPPPRLRARGLKLETQIEVLPGARFRRPRRRLLAARRICRGSAG